MALAASADLRYIGQFNEVEVPLPSDPWNPAGLERLLAGFHQRHEELNGYRMASAPVELVNLRVVGTGIVDKPELVKSARAGAAAPLGSRAAFFGDGFTEVPVYDGLQLPAGCDLAGPAIVEQSTTTVVVQPGYRLSCDDFGNYLVYRDETTLEDSIAALKRSAS